MCKEKKKKRRKQCGRGEAKQNQNDHRKHDLPMVLAGAPEMGCLHEKQIRQWENNLILM